MSSSSGSSSSQAAVAVAQAQLLADQAALDEATAAAAKDSSVSQTTVPAQPAGLVDISA